MITLLVRQGGQPEVEVNVSGNTVNVGRAPGSHVHLTQTYVSKKHLRVLKGIVIVDLGSANGTFLDGERLKAPVLYTGGELRIGDGDVYMKISVDDDFDPPADCATLIAEPTGAVLGRGKVDKSELERLNAQLAASEKRVSELERLGAQLEASEKRVQELEAESAQRAEEASQRLQELEALKEQQSQVTGPPPAQLEAEAALESARAEVEALRAQLAAVPPPEPKAAVPSSPAAELFLKLQSENSSLKRKLAELQSKPGTVASVPATVVSDATPAKLLAQIVELRAQNAALRARSDTVVAPRESSSNVRALFLRLSKDDVDRQAPLLTGSLEEFLVLEQFRLARTVERIVTRMAGDAIELIDGRTMLPELQGDPVNGLVNLRQLISRLGDATEDPSARGEMLQYCAHLSRWLVALLGADRKAALAFTHQLKADLTEERLTANTPIPALKRLSGQADGELWRRASAYLRELTPDMIQDRLEKMTRATVLEIVGDEGAPRPSD